MFNIIKIYMSGTFNLTQLNTSNIDISSELSVGGDTTIGGHIIPSANDTFDIGSAERKIRDLYVSDNSIWIGDETKISFSDGKMKFRKRKKDVVPEAIIAAGSQAGHANSDATKNAALAYAGVGSVTDMKIHHWHNYMRTLQATALMTDIFRDNKEDYEETSASDAWKEINDTKIYTDTNVGIGTSDPESTLHIRGSIKVEDGFSLARNEGSNPSVVIDTQNFGVDTTVNDMTGMGSSKYTKLYRVYGTNSEGVGQNWYWGYADDDYTHLSLSSDGGGSPDPDISFVFTTASELYCNKVYAALSGNADTATRLQTARNINGVAFDGSADITIPVPTASSLGLENSATIAASTSHGASTIVQRTGDGYVYANYYNTTPNDVSSGVTKVCVETGNDGFIRHGTADGIRSFFDSDNRYIRRDIDNTVGTNVNLTWLNSDEPCLRLQNASYNAWLMVGGWSSTNSNDISRVRASNGNLHIDSAANGSLYCNWYSSGDIRLGRNTEVRGKLTADYIGNIQRDGYASGYMIGHQNGGDGGSENYTNPIYTIGTSHLPSATSLNDMYGIGYSHGNFSSILTGGWGMYVASDGDARIGLNASHGNIKCTGQLEIGTECYIGNWARFKTDRGLHWEPTSNGHGHHIYPKNRADMFHRSGSGNGSICGTVENTTARGYIHWTTSNEIGFLTSSRHWSLRMDNSKNCSVYGNNYSYAYHGHSDTRMKKNIVHADDTTALNLIREIKPRIYEYIDTPRRGTHSVYGFIAQEIKELMPNAVTMREGEIPNIYQNATFDKEQKIITFENFDTGNLHQTKDIICRVDNGEVETHLSIKSVLNSKQLEIEEDDEFKELLEESEIADEIFVWGQTVDDFHSIDKNYIFTVATSALQEVDRQQQKDKLRITSLENELQSMNSKFAELEKMVLSLSS